MHLTPLTGTLIAVGAIWAAVLLAGLFSPDLVHGSEQQHLPIAAITWWFWAMFATAFALLPLAARAHRPAEPGMLWTVLATTISVIWLLAALLSIFTERHVTGSDPTQFPIAAVLAPVAAMMASGFVAGFIAIFARADST
jgi:hypothetical protein